MIPRKVLQLSVVLILLCAGTVIAQETQTTTPGQPNTAIDLTRRRGGPGFRRQMRLQRRRQAVAHALQLTEEQRQQQRSIRQKYLASTKPLRQQLFDMREKRLAGTFTQEDLERTRALRQEMRTSLQEIRSEMLSTLTTDQRARLETIRQQRQQRREEMLQRREEFLRKRPTN